MEKTKMEKRKYSVALLVSLILTLCFTLGSVVPMALAQSSKPIKLTFNSFLSAGTADSVADKIWMDYVTEKTNGRVTFETFFSGGLASAKEHVNAIKSGLCDIGTVGGAYFPADFPLNGLFMPLYITDKPDVAGKAAEILQKEMPAFQQEYARQNMKLMVGYGIGPVFFGRSHEGSCDHPGTIEGDEDPCHGSFG